MSRVLGLIETKDVLYHNQQRGRAFHSMELIALKRHQRISDRDGAYWWDRDALLRHTYEVHAEDFNDCSGTVGSDEAKDGMTAQAAQQIDETR